MGLMLFAFVAISVAVEEAAVLPMHPVELGDAGVDADVVRKTVKEITFKDAKKGMDNQGNSVDLAANMKQIEDNLLAGTHPAAAVPAKTAAVKAAPAKEVVRAKEEAPAKDSLGESTKDDAPLDFSIPDIKIGAKEMLKAAGVKQAELGAEQETPAKEADPTGIPAVPAPVAPAPAPAVPTAATPAPTLQPPSEAAIKVVKEQANKLLEEKAAAEKKQKAEEKAAKDAAPQPKDVKAKRDKLAAQQAAAQEAKDAADAKEKAERQKEIQKEAKDREESREMLDSTDPARTDANKASREASEKAKAKEAADAVKKGREKKAQLKAEYERGVRDGKKMLDSWKTNAAISIANAIAMANKEAPHTNDQTHDMAKAAKAAQAIKSTVDNAEKAAADAALAVMSPDERLAKANKEADSKEADSKEDSKEAKSKEAKSKETDDKTAASKPDASATDVLKPGKAGTEATEEKVNELTKKANAAEKADQAKHKAEVEVAKTQGKNEANKQVAKDRAKHEDKKATIDTTETHEISKEAMTRHTKKKGESGSEAATTTMDDVESAKVKTHVATREAEKAKAKVSA